MNYMKIDFTDFTCKSDFLIDCFFLDFVLLKQNNIFYEYNRNKFLFKFFFMLCILILYISAMSKYLSLEVVKVKHRDT